MVRLVLASAFFATSLTAASPVGAAGYRGMTAGWPYYANGYYAAYQPQQPPGQPAYYVARPVVAANTGGAAPTVVMRPVTAAYANPTYFAAYGKTHSGVQTVQYAAPGVAHYAPTTTNYAPANAYSVSPAGAMTSGAEAATYYGQPQAVNYVPPRFAYRTTYAPTPVYMYRPVTAYNPVTAQPTTCLQATTSTCCMPQRRHDWSWLWPWNWFRHLHGGCGAAPPPTTAYCGPQPCGQPYYPAPTTVVPTVPGTTVIPSMPGTTVIPTTPGTTVIPTIPGTTVIPTVPGGTIGTPRIPPPGTRFPGSIPSTGVPADTRPSLTPGGTIISPIPGTVPGTTAPGTIISPPATIPGATPLPGSFPTVPPSSGTGNFPSGSNYPPLADPYRSSTQGNATHTQGASLHGELQRATPRILPSAGSAPREMELAPALPPSVRTVPDPDAPQAVRPGSRAPQLLNPRDRVATPLSQRWAVVPAVWPKKTHLAVHRRERELIPTKAFEPHTTASLAASPYAPHALSASSPSPASRATVTEDDDRGWTTGRGW